MCTLIYCRSTGHDVHSFYLVANNTEYYLFTQSYKKGVHAYYHNGVVLNQALDFSRAHYDGALIRTMKKLPSYIRYIEKEYEIEVFEQTKKHGSKHKYADNIEEIRKGRPAAKMAV